MMISLRGPALYLRGAAFALLVVVVGCGRGSSPEQTQGKPVAAEHKAEGA